MNIVELSSRVKLLETLANKMNAHELSGRKNELLVSNVKKYELSEAREADIYQLGLLDGIGLVIDMVYELIIKEKQTMGFYEEKK